MLKSGCASCTSCHQIGPGCQAGFQVLKAHTMSIMNIIHMMMVMMMVMMMMGDAYYY